MVDIVLKLTKDEIEVGGTPVTVGDSILFRVFAPSTSKIYTLDADDNPIGSMTIPGGFVEIMEKRKTDKVKAEPAVLCTPVAYK